MEVYIKDFSKQYLGEDSSSIDATKERLERELKDLQARLDVVQDKRDSLETQRLNNKSELELLRNKNQDDLEGRNEELEESRRALLALQRLSAAEISNLEKHWRNMQSEVEDLRLRLEAEVAEKNDESSGRRKLAIELKDLQIKLDTEIAKTSDLTDSVALYKTKARTTLSKLEQVEIARIKAEKSEIDSKIQLKEVESSLADAISEKKQAEDRLAALEEQVRELTEKAGEAAQEISDLAIANKNLTDGMEQLSIRQKNEIEERETDTESIRTKYGKENKALLAELEMEKRSGVQLKDVNKDLERDLKKTYGKLDSELRSAASYKKEKERMEAQSVFLSFYLTPKG
jgi:myosin protein heavy chain